MCVAAAIAGAGLAGSVGGALISGNAAQSAANTQAAADQQSAQIQENEFNTVQQETAPQRALGTGASGLLANLWGLPNPTTGAAATAPNYSGFLNSPGYKFTVGQADQALNRQAAAGGNLYSTNTLANLGNLNAGLASTQYNNYVNQLMTAAGLGNAATSTSAGAGTTLAGNAGSAVAGAGAAQAAGIYNSGSAYSSALGSLTNHNSGLLSGIYGAGGYANPGVGNQYPGGLNTSAQPGSYNSDGYYVSD